LSSGCRDGDVEWTENEFADAQFADAGQNRIERALTRNVGNLQTPQIRRIENRPDRAVRIIDGNEKENRSIVRRLADTGIDDAIVQRRIVGPQMSADLRELCAIHEIEAMHQVDLEKVVPCDEQAHQSRGSGAAYHSASRAPMDLTGVGSLCRETS